MLSSSSVGGGMKGKGKGHGAATAAAAESSSREEKERRQLLVVEELPSVEGSDVALARLQAAMAAFVALPPGATYPAVLLYTGAWLGMVGR